VARRKLLPQKVSIVPRQLSWTVHGSFRFLPSGRKVGGCLDSSLPSIMAMNSYAEARTFVADRVRGLVSYVRVLCCTTARVL